MIWRKQTDECSEFLKTQNKPKETSIWNGQYVINGTL